MTQTIEVRFKGTRKAYFVWEDEADPIRVKEPVIVEVERGRDLGRVTAVGDMAAQEVRHGCSSCAVGEAGGRARAAEAGGAPGHARGPARPTGRCGPRRRKSGRRSSSGCGPTSCS